MTPKEFAKKIIASINPGTADISGIGDGTIKGAISEQNKNITWKLAGSATGTTKVNLPNTFNELLVVVARSDNKQRMCYHIPSIEIADGDNIFALGFHGNDAYDQIGVIFVTKTTVHIHEFINNSSNVTSNAKLRVYYR